MSECLLEVVPLAGGWCIRTDGRVVHGYPERETAALVARRAAADLVEQGRAVRLVLRSSPDKDV